MYSHNPHGQWTNQHQMSINGKRDHFILDDLLIVADSAGIPKVIDIIREVSNAVEKWPEFSLKAGVNKKISNDIGPYHQLKLQNQR